MPAPIRRHILEARANLNKARAALSKGTTTDRGAHADWKWDLDQSLKDSALQLREALEIIAYKLLLSRSNIVNQYEVNRWQPGKVIKILADLADEGIVQDSTVRIRRQTEPGVPAVTGEPVLTMSKKGIRVRDIEKVYNSLGSLLHIKVPQNSDRLYRRIDDYDDATKILSDAIEYAARFESANDFVMNLAVTFECWGTTAGGLCCEVITRPEFALEKNPFVSCPLCRMDYEAVKKNSGWHFQEATPQFPCSSCGKAISVPIAEIADLKRKYERQRNPLPLHEAATLTKPCPTTGCEGSVVISLGITYKLELGESGEAK